MCSIYNANKQDIQVCYCLLDASVGKPLTKTTNKSVSVSITQLWIGI